MNGQGVKINLAESLSCLVAGAVLFALSGPVSDVPCAPWLAPVFLLRWLRGSRPLLRFAGMLLLLDVCWFPLNRSFLPIPGPAAFVAASLFVGYASFSFGAHRLIAPRLPSLAGTLVLPVAGVMLEYLMGFQFTGTLFSSVYSQAACLRLAQIASVAGIWPIIFVMLWFGSTADYCWEVWRTPRRAVPVVACYTVCLGSILVYGSFRVASTSSASEVKMAAITADSVPIGRAAHLADTGQTLDIPDNVDEASPQVQKMQLSLNHFSSRPRAATICHRTRCRSSNSRAVVGRDGQAGRCRRTDRGLVRGSRNTIPRTGECVPATNSGSCPREEALCLCRDGYAARGSRRISRPGRKNRKQGCDVRT